MSASQLLGIASVVIALAVLVAVVRGFRTISASVGNVRAEFSNNGGSSFKDAIDSHFAQVHDRFDDLEARVTGLEDMVTAPRRKKASA